MAKPRLLIVDDSRFMRNHIKTELQNENMEVCGEAENAGEAILKYKELSPDLMIIDIVMPEINNINTISAIEQIIKTDTQAKIIVLSSIGHYNAVLKAINAGAKDYIVKPAQTGKLVTSIHKALGLVNPT